MELQEITNTSPRHNIFVTEGGTDNKTSIFQAVKRKLTVVAKKVPLLLKFFLSVIDISTDISFGMKLINGSFGLLLYKLAETKSIKEEYLYSQHKTWGSITLVIAWIPGAVKMGLMAVMLPWRDMSKVEILKTLVFLLFMTFIWPIFSVLL